MGGVRMCASSMDAPKKSPWCAFTEASSSHLAALRVVMVGEGGGYGDIPQSRPNEWATLHYGYTCV